MDMACGMLGGHRRGARWGGGTPAGARRTDGDGIGMRWSWRGGQGGSMSGVRGVF